MRRTAALLIVLGLVFSTRVSAQPAVSVRGNVGAAFFQSPEGLNNVLNSGVDLGLEAGLEVYDGLEVVLQGSYDRFTLNSDNVALLDDNLSVGTSVEGGALNLINGTVGLRYTLKNQSDAHPYVAGGIGLYRTELAEARVRQGENVLPERSTRGRGFHLAIGSNFRVNETYGVFFEPRYVVVDTGGSDLQTGDSTRYVTVRLGVEVQF
ncbi:outer membrane beta-barrel protein [Salinibacter ruber]|jgi:opacity protein-like surface antigen|uniref:Opacity protein-like surface antigen n=2 Tax=Salinibacter ruber TaxID=146919 RepID=A0AAW5P4G3_9BACT|nr:outer membrane beta-barrel protein [Salinibacter ruber]MCS3662990.1 opacity protein-like surface antigen [Salinibacter ruber]MCS3683649.1 opacity protein-like surface antigen [Salinibacter ruber]MCS3702514.1 opacity protein-like surface antigen [Salinibacter ruber]MCS3853546.1 opacity protein-like surface antigen [Salinibacter ruber]MCS4115069.1 opacity protein-like surface antigen [Salinibacter ruber]